MNKHLHKIINRGIKETDTAETRRQIGLLNLATLCCFATVFFFIVLNIYHQNWLLLGNNLFLCALTVCLLYIYKLKFFNTSIIILCLLFSGYFLADALLFQNSLQYAIIVMMVVSALLIQNNTWRIIVLCVQVVLFMVYVIKGNKPPVIKPLPVYRNQLTILSMLVIIALMLLYFKRRQLQYIDDLTKLNAQLQESNRVRERMLSILSHDFNAPIANLNSALTLADAEALTPQQFNQITSKLQSRLNILNNSLSDVLQWSKMEITGNAAMPAEVAVPDLVVEMVQLFDYPLKDKNLEVIHNISPGITVMANKDHLKLILRNLLSNAIKFSHPGNAITIHAYVRDNVVNISIRDEGTGMPAPVLTALQQQKPSLAATSGTSNERGTGIGLMLVNEFLQKNSGRLTIESAPGKGSTFIISLPAPGTES